MIEKNNPARKIEIPNTPEILTKIVIVSEDGFRINLATLYANYNRLSTNETKVSYILSKMKTLLNETEDLE